MARVIIFSRVKDCRETFFVEQFLNARGIDFRSLSYASMLANLNPNIPAGDIADFYNSLNPRELKKKYHTIRGGQGRNVGDYFSPRVWAGRPYKSRQIVIAPDTQIKKIWDITKINKGEPSLFYSEKIKARDFISTDALHIIALNDGLPIGFFLKWFHDPFEGQIICWENKIVYRFTIPPSNQTSLWEI